MANFCRKHKIWFHVDGAHGRSVTFKNMIINQWLKKQTHSFGMHKMLRVPSLCTAVLFKDQKNVEKPNER